MGKHVETWSGVEMRHYIQVINLYRIHENWNQEVDFYFNLVERLIPDSRKHVLITLIGATEFCKRFLQRLKDFNANEIEVESSTWN